MGAGLRLLAVLLPTVLLLPAPAVAAGPRTGSGTDVTTAQAAVERLRAEVARVATELGDAAVALDEGQARLDVLRQREYRAGESVEEARAGARSAQFRMDALARAAYRGGGYPELSALLNGDLKAVADYRQLQQGLEGAAQRHETVVTLLGEARVRAARTEEQAARDREAAQALQARIDAQTEALRARALEAQRRLDDAAAALRVAQARASLSKAAALRARREAAARSAAAATASGAASGLSGPPTCRTAAADDAVNGFLRSEQLCALSASGQALAVGAAQAYEALSATFAGTFKRPLCVTDSYRDYASQIDVFRRKPTLAATPGRSQHGLGRALDLCGGIESFGTPEHRWMQANAERLGFTHPAWARAGGSRPEAWHWEWTG